MRIHTYTNGATVKYPEAITFKNDRNVAIFSHNGEYKVRGEVYITEDDSVTIFDTVCYGGRLYVNLNSCIMAAGLELPQTFPEVDLIVTIGGTEENFKVMNWSFLVGETMRTRTHPSEREIVVPADVSTIEIYAEGNGFAYPEGEEIAFPEGAGAKIVSLPFYTHSAEDEVLISEDEDRTLYNLSDEWHSQANVVKIVRGDACSGTIQISYYNADGCKRYAVGKIMSETVGKESDVFVGGEINDYDPSDGNPKEVIKCIDREIEVGFADVPDARNFIDILLNEKVGTPWGDMVIVDQSMTQKKGTADYTLKLRYKA